MKRKCLIIFPFCHISVDTQSQICTLICNNDIIFMAQITCLHSLILTIVKRCPFHYRGLECKSRKSRNTWSNRQIWTWSTEWSWAKANRGLPRERTGHRSTIFQLHKRRLYTWKLLHGQHWNQIDYILCSQRWRSSIQSAKTRLGADCGSGRELLIAKFRLKLKKVRKPLDHSGVT